MKYKIDDKITYYCDLNERNFFGVIKSINPMDKEYLIQFPNNTLWVDENQIQLTK